MEALVVFAILGVVVLVVIWLWVKVGKPYMDQAARAAAETRAPSQAASVKPHSAELRRKVAREMVAAEYATPNGSHWREGAGVAERYGLSVFDVHDEYMAALDAREQRAGDGVDADSRPSPAGRPTAIMQESRYLHSSRWDELLVPAASGMPPLYLTNTGGELWLAEETTGLLVNVGNRKLRKLGLWTVSLRGAAHYKAAVRAGELSPGSRVRLEREPHNEYDSNAVAVHALNTPGVLGHFNKGMAPALSKLMDGGEKLSATALTGDPAGKYSAEPIKIVAASPTVMAHIRRRL